MAPRGLAHEAGRTGALVGGAQRLVLSVHGYLPAPLCCQLQSTHRALVPLLCAAGFAEEGEGGGVGDGAYPAFYDSEGEDEGDAEWGLLGSEGSWEGEQPVFELEEAGWEDGAAAAGAGGPLSGATTASVRDMLRQLLNRLKLLHPTIARVDTPSQVRMDGLGRGSAHTWQHRVGWLGQTMLIYGRRPAAIGIICLMLIRH